MFFFLCFLDLLSDLSKNRNKNGVNMVEDKLNILCVMTVKIKIFLLMLI